MRKFILQTFGILFLITGLLTVFFSLLNKSKFFLSATVHGIDIGALVYGFLTFSAGYNILRRNSLGRILAIIALCPYLFVFVVLAVFIGFQVLSGDAEKMPYIMFLGTQYGMSKDYSVTDPLIAASIFFVSTFITGLIIWFFISKNTAILFRREKISVL